MSNIKGVITKASAPTVSDDNTKGFYEGYQWVDSSTGTVYEVSDVSTGAAVWNVSSSSGASGNSYNFNASNNNGSINSSVDMRGGGNVLTNVTPFIVPAAGKLYGISAAHGGAIAGTNWTARVLKNGSGVANLVLNVTAKNQVSNLNVAVAAGDEIRLRLIHTSGTIVRPMITAFFKND